jgi:hypothetical protein
MPTEVCIWQFFVNNGVVRLSSVYFDRGITIIRCTMHRDLIAQFGKSPNKSAEDQTYVTF